MKENLIKCIVRTSNGLIVKCWLTNETIKELKSKNLVPVRKINKIAFNCFLNENKIILKGVKLYGLYNKKHK